MYMENSVRTPRPRPVSRPVPPTARTTRMTGPVATVVGIAAALAAVAGTASAAPQAAPTAPAPGAAATGTGTPVRQVKLMTGDTVTIGGAVPSSDTGSVSVDPGPGREDVGFSVKQLSGRTYVFPNDVLRQVTRGVLDRSLFDVTGTPAAPTPRRMAEAPMHNLTIRYVDETGAPATEANTRVMPVDDPTGPWQFVGPEANGEVTVAVPEGTYALDSTVYADSGTRMAVLVQPRLALTADAVLVVDARTAQPISVTMPDARAVPEAFVYDYGGTVGSLQFGGLYLTDKPSDIRIADLGGAQAGDRLASDISGTWAVPSADPDTPARERFRAAWDDPNGIMTAFTAAPALSEFATVNRTYHAVGTGTRVGYVGMATVGRGGSWSVTARVDLPSQTVEHVLGNDIRWGTTFMQARLDGSGKPIPDNNLEGNRAYTSGTTRNEVFNAAVFGPSSDPGMYPVSPYGGTRTGDGIRIAMPMFGDGNGHSGSSEFTEAYSYLAVNGGKVFETSTPLMPQREPYAVPSGDSLLEVGSRVQRDPAVFPVSTDVSARWTFRSAHVPDGTKAQLPLSTVRFTPLRAADGTTALTRVHYLPLTVEGAATTLGVSRLQVQVSYDDGASWRAAPMIGNGAVITPPTHATHVSLRVNLTDGAGNTLDQTIVRAYALPNK